MLKSFRNNIKSLSGFRNRGVPVYRDFYTMKIEAENCWVSREFRFTEVLVLRGSTVYVKNVHVI